MAEERVRFADWQGENVMVNLVNGDAPVGVLEEVNDWGLVLRSEVGIWWTPDEPPDDEGFIRSKQVFRTVSEFYPWTMVGSVRVLEPDESVERGL
jgi:hypothetical protein